MLFPFTETGNHSNRHISTQPKRRCQQLFHKSWIFLLIKWMSLENHQVLILYHGSSEGKIHLRGERRRVASHVFVLVCHKLLIWIFIWFLLFLYTFLELLMDNWKVFSQQSKIYLVLQILRLLQHAVWITTKWLIVFQQ